MLESHLLLHVTNPCSLVRQIQDRGRIGARRRRRHRCTWSDGQPDAATANKIEGTISRMLLRRCFHQCER